MKPFQLREAVQATGGAYHGGPALLEQPVAGVAIDSHKVAPGFLFVPIIGDNHDGHSFIPAAADAGALCCFSQRELPDGQPYILVPSSLRAFQNLAAWYKSRFSVITVGVTGSAGKTTTKEMIAGVLAQKYDTLKTEGNFNNQTGVPLTVFRLEDHHQAAVIEMGTNHFGEIAALSRIVRPDLCVLTNIGDAHIEHLGSKEGILRAKSEMLDHMAADGTVLVNGDDPLLATLKGCGKKVVTFGISGQNGIHAENLREQGLDGTAFTAAWPGGRAELFVPVPGRHMVENALAALAAGLALGVPAEQAVRAIAGYVPVGDRMKRIHANGFTILNDAYNANPSSMKAALDALAAADGRKVAILGDMFELGAGAESYHRQVGAHAAAKADLLLCVGESAKYMWAEATKNTAAFWYPTQEALAAALAGYLVPGDTVLVKASRGMALEKTVAALMAANFFEGATC